MAGQGETSSDRGGSGNRRTQRARRRLMVRFGTEAAERTGFTKDISETGVFIRTNMVARPGTTLQVELQFPDRSFQLWARVVWAKKVPPQLAHLMDCGMGVCFIDPPADWIDYCLAWKAKIGV
jgi:hypothetical protein